MSSTKNNFKETTFNSVSWKFVERGLTNGAQFLIGIILARLLLPSDYGVIAILAIFIAISQTIIDSGLSQVVIQKPNRDESDFAGMFYTNLVISVFLYIVMYAISPYIATFYKIPELCNISRIYSLILLINAFTITPKTKSTIKLDFKTQAKITIVSILVSGLVGIALAYQGFGVWALVYQQLTNGILQMIAYHLVEKGFIMREVSWLKIKENFNKGSKLLMANLVHTFYSNMHPIIIGKVFNSFDLGLFSRGDQMIKILPMNISDVISNTAYPIFCKLNNEEGIESFKDKFLKYVHLSAFLFFPLNILLIAIAKPLILILLTNKWEGCIIYMQILGFAYMLDPILRLNSYFPIILGRTDIVIKMEVIKKTIAVLFLIIGAMISIKAICIGMVMYNLADLLVSTFFMNKLAGIGIKEELKMMARPLIYNFGILLLVLLVNSFVTNNWLTIATDIVVIGAIYLLLLTIRPVAEINSLLLIVKSKIHKS